MSLRLKWISLAAAPMIAALLITGLFAQRSRQSPPPPAQKQAPAKQEALKYRRYKVVGSSPGMEVSAKTADAVRKNPQAQQFIEVNGNVLKARKGLAFAKLGNGKSILTNDSNAAMPYMDTLITKVEWGTIIWVCRCAGSTKAGDDNCVFENKNPQTGGKCTGGDCCMRSVLWLDDATGEWGNAGTVKDR